MKKILECNGFIFRTIVIIPENRRCKQRNKATNDWKNGIPFSMSKDTWQFLASVRKQPENGHKLQLLVLPCEGEHEDIGSPHLELGTGEVFMCAKYRKHRN